MATDRSVLARALTALRERAVFGGDGLVITDPWAVLDRLELPRECVALLVNAHKCLVGLGKGRFRVVRESLPSDEPPPLPEESPARAVGDPTPITARPAPPPVEPARVARFLLILDAENALWTHRDAGIPFDPAAIRDRAAGIGTIAFAFAYGNFEKIPPRV